MRIEVRPPKGSEWQELIQKSHQTSMYVSEDWIEIGGLKRLVAVSMGSVLAGVAYSLGHQPPPFVPYAGLLLTKREQPNIVRALLEAVEDESGIVSIWNAPALVDVRPFIWRYQEDKRLWRFDLRYQFFLDKNCRPFDDLVLGSPPEESPGFHRSTNMFFNDEEEVILERILNLKGIRHYLNKQGGEAVIGSDLQNRGYLILAGGNWAGLVYQLAQKFDSFDLGGANSARMNKDKRIFGAKLRTVYGCIYRSA